MTWFFGGLIGAALTAIALCSFFVWVAAEAKGEHEQESLRCYEGGDEHAFEAIFDSEVVEAAYSGVKHAVRNTYVRHVCIDCGTTVERPQRSVVSVFGNNNGDWQNVDDEPKPRGTVATVKRASRKKR